MGGAQALLLRFPQILCHHGDSLQSCLVQIRAKGYDMICPVMRKA